MVMALATHKADSGEPGELVPQARVGGSESQPQKVLAPSGNGGSETLEPAQRFLASSPHPVIITVTAEFMLYQSSKKLLYASGEVRYSGRGFNVVAQTLRLDVGSRRALLTSVRGNLRKGERKRSFAGDVLRIDFQSRRGILTTYGDRIETERIWFPEKDEIASTQLELQFSELESGPIDADLTLIIESPVYLQLDKVKIDPESRVRAWGVVPHINGEPGPRLPYFSFRTGDAVPRQGVTIQSLGASNLSGILANVQYALSPAEMLLTTFSARYEELSFLNDPFRAKRRARFGFRQLFLLGSGAELEARSYYQTDGEWKGRLGFDLQRGAHTLSAAGQLGADPVTGKHQVLSLRHLYEKEQFRSSLEAAFDLGTELSLRFNIRSRTWRDRLDLTASSRYLKRFDQGIYQPAEVLSQRLRVSLSSNLLRASINYSGSMDLEREQTTLLPSLTIESLPKSIGGGFLASVVNRVEFSSIHNPTFTDDRLNDEAWLLLQHVPIQFTRKLLLDARMRVSQKTLQDLNDETEFNGLVTLTQRFGRFSSASVTYRYVTVRQTNSDWWTLGTVLQEVSSSSRIQLGRSKSLILMGSYSISEGRPLNASSQFNGDFGTLWRGSARASFDFFRNRFSALDVSISRDVFFGWMRITYRQVQNELTVQYTARVF